MKIQNYLQKIKEEFPDLKWKKFRMITKGWDFIVVMLDNKIVFRFPREDNDSVTLRNEIGFLKKLRKKTGTKVPYYDYVAKDKSFAGYALIPGKQLKKWRFDKLTTDQKINIAKHIARFLSDLHTISVSTVEEFNISRSDPKKSFDHLVNFTEKYVFPKLNDKEIFLIRKHFKDLSMHVKDKFRPVIVHADFSSDHIIWDESKKTVGIIDFGDFGVGDPAKDFSWLYLFGQKFVENIYRQYRGHKDAHFLHRAFLNYKSIPLRMMIGASRGFPVSFNSGYKMFKDSFK